jgi:uncharacterized membrane protein
MPKIAKRFVSLSYTAKRVYRKIATTKPSVFIVAAAIAALSIFLLGGGVYNILEGFAGNLFVGIPIGSRIVFFYPGTLAEQTLLDSLFVMISYFLGVIGILLVYQSTKYAAKPRQAFIFLLLGALFILFAYFNVENLILAKLTATTS